MYSTKEHKKKEDLPAQKPCHGGQAAVAAHLTQNLQNLNKGCVESGTSSTMRMIGGSIVIASTQLLLFRTDSKSGNSDSNLIDSIALAEFMGAAVKEEDDLSERFITLRLYNKEDDVLWLDLTYPQLEDDLEEQKTQALTMTAKPPV